MKLEHAIAALKAIKAEVTSQLLTASLNKDRETAAALDILHSNIDTDLGDISENPTIKTFIDGVSDTLTTSYKYQTAHGYNIELGTFNTMIDTLLQEMRKEDGITIRQVVEMYKTILLEVMRDEVEAFKNNQRVTGIRLKLLRKMLDQHRFDETGRNVYKACILAVLSFAYESQLGEHEPSIANYIERLYDLAQIEVA